MLRSGEPRWTFSPLELWGVLRSPGYPDHTCYTLSYCHTSLHSVDLTASFLLCRDGNNFFTFTVKSIFNIKVRNNLPEERNTEWSENKCQNIYFARSRTWGSSPLSGRRLSTTHNLAITVSLQGDVYLVEIVVVFLINILNSRPKRETNWPKGLHKKFIV